jgi:putative nucleotidyltransferase with HDIG domain
MAIPSRAECFCLMEEYGMLPHIREHSLLVTEVALWLGRRLTETGVSLHLPLIEAGALLHDLGKTACLGTMINHAEWGAQALEARGWPDVAQVVREHVRLKEDGQEGGPLRETAIVNYADKRVLHTQVVLLGERFADLKVRYGTTPTVLARIADNEARSQKLEQKIFSFLSHAPHDLLYLNDTRRKS